MNKRVLLINITRMGDLVQMGTLLQRLQHEWPGAEVDLVVDQRFAPVAKLLPHLRHIVEYDFHRLVDESRAQTKDVVTLYHDMTRWAAPLVEARYDRVVNLTFNRRSGLLTSYVGAKEIRGIAAPKDGDVTIHNPWMAYLTDVHHERRFNHFNLVDIYALGGSGSGPFAPLSLTIPPDTAEWARNFLATQGGQVRSWTAVQVGASDPMKAWRPELFGQTLAALSRQTTAGYVFIGTEEERKAIHLAQTTYRKSGGTGPLCDAVGKTSLPQLAAVLSQCRLLLTNDTGPMHLAVGVGTPVIDLSVGHVDFRETGPYGPGHWMVQPDLGCAPCGFDQVCFHHACKDRIVPDQVAALCLHVLAGVPFPRSISGVRIYRSCADEDGLGNTELQAGREDLLVDWYGRFWRRFWFEEFTGRPSRVPCDHEPSPDCSDALAVLEHLKPLAKKLVSNAEELVRLTTKRPLPVSALQQMQRLETAERQQIVALSMQSPAAASLAVAMVRDTHNDDGHELTGLAQSRLATYRRWHKRLQAVSNSFRSFTAAQGSVRRGKTRQLPMARSA
ncbi:MAG: glycosyltransferase family 9 protein [Nitrospira sp.]|nr:glycosyltransferase family 9 protein [Nitrospira sp.]HMW86894.1 glycosyltransferase family 9 protein [Nitrospira sp.]HNC81975.1 glycosyltransferase family 9 protein [Nitrospira sp.]HNE30740.1 glycosyltransferase family 9 protein [Nitrospira sp.]HNG02135.1 glycosyltransferase family 9 protein [Nitrospira sp.]